jgi:hypothetical protein
MDGHRQASPELGLSEEQQGEPVLRVHVVVGQEAQVFEHVGAQVVGLVDDEDRPAAGLGGHTGDLAADLAEERRPRPLDREAHFPGDGLVEVEDVAGGEADVEDAVERGVELCQDATRAAGLSAAGISGDEADAAHLEQVL